MNILSLFDGISGARVALEKTNIKVDRYYASEIDLDAIAVSKYNYPDTIQLGNVLNVHNVSNIDLLIGGSPCQSFSTAGKKEGFNGISGLVKEYFRILKETNPKYFILENVVMPHKYRAIINKELGIEPIMINSALLSGQQRKRLYWTNIPISDLPPNKHIYLKDIIEENVNKCMSKEGAILTDARYDTGHYDKIFKVGYMITPYKTYIIYGTQGKSRTLLATGGGRNGQTGIYLIGDCIRHLTPLEAERLQTYPDNYTKFGIYNNQKKEIKSITLRRKLLGNSFTVDVIAWLLSHINRND